MENTSNRVIVVGAGVAGLAAAREFRCAGFDVLVLEARERAGGRVLTVRDPLTAVPVELGAEFVHGVHPELWGILREMRAPVLELFGEHWARDSAGFHPADDSWEESARIFEAMSRANEQSFGEFLAGIRAPEKAKQAAASFVEGFNAARKELVSVQWLKAEERASDEIDGGRSFRVLGGYDSVAKYLARDADIRFGAEVTDVHWRPGEVVVKTARGEQFRGSCAVIAVPFAILQQERLRVDPEPATLAAALSAIITGNAIRITFRFPHARWANFGPHISFIHGGDCFPVWWTAYPIQFPVITGWAAGPKAEALAGVSEAELKRIALDSLRGILGEDPGQPEAAWVHDWRSDPFALGAYSYVRVNGIPAHEEFRKPVENTICFAGEALATGHMGTVHGAIASGIEAARLLVQAIR